MLKWVPDYDSAADEYSKAGECYKACVTNILYKYPRTINKYVQYNVTIKYYIFWRYTHTYLSTWFGYTHIYWKAC